MAESTQPVPPPAPPQMSTQGVPLPAQLPLPQAVGLLGSGSYATALAWLLGHKGIAVHWHFRRQDDAEAVRATGTHTRYLPHAQLNTACIHPTTDLAQALAPAVLLLAVPSAYAGSLLAGATAGQLAGKIVLSGIKGLEPETGLLPSQWLVQRWQLPAYNVCALGGPGHAEEISAGRDTYLTVAGHSQPVREMLARLLTTDRLHVAAVPALAQLEYGGALKNVYAVAAGMALGLGYGDNFVAVLLSAALREQEGLLALHQDDASAMPLAGSALLGDLLATAYSLNSRNRRLGLLVGQGQAPAAAVAQMPMVAEGYHVSRLLAQRHGLHAPILDTVYAVLHEGVAAAVAFDRLRMQLG